MKVYHYTYPQNILGIVDGSYHGDGITGLVAKKRLGIHDHEAFNTTAVFALLEPVPDAWAKNSFFNDYWQIMKKDIGNILLEIETNPQVDNVFVIDRAHIAGHLLSDQRVPDKYRHELRGDAEKAYLRSKISLKDYLNLEKEMQYSLPEVVFFENIPLDRISVSDQQPRLEEKIKEQGVGSIIDVINGPVKEILVPWRRIYESQYGPLENTSRTNESLNRFLAKRSRI